MIRGKIRRYVIVNDKYCFTTIYCLGEVKERSNGEWLKNFIKEYLWEEDIKDSSFIVVDFDEKNKLVNTVFMNKNKSVREYCVKDKSYLWGLIEFKVILSLMKVLNKIKLNKCKIIYWEGLCK